MSEKLLLLFVRNPELGKVKTRLAASVGPEKALAIYKRLLEHTFAVTRELAVHKEVCYSDYLDEQDLWPSELYAKRVQPDGDLGEKMEAVFATAFEAGYNSVVIIGSDCLELTPAILQQAYDELTRHDVVIGPAADGGYYLLGMNQLYPALFRNKAWSTEQVLPATLQDVKALQLSHSLLPCLSDVDHAEDLQHTGLL
ncbi:TIGR04282 family arsenosugar biosynthesis glycosyltransferase [Pontibacter sp. E15-1]|uniref:TIGR04282 family arsenosugar biosynthesis glycosyltransferase n=1 Tax=Pontibacter sp. E15-1 TaxID=2919918 RepID=UPI001F4FD010|nr:TIGR04282 family arsenosugar biosynthesis glycosyltransferase [Pontibacter sp. E15-1]MCJ8166677.1 TIGR04282 family arsenosugar biosynthesis glycosyltransferase [Pontibacter sp. E15-1]